MRKREREKGKEGQKRSKTRLLMPFVLLVSFIQVLERGEERERKRTRCREEKEIGRRERKREKGMKKRRKKENKMTW